MSSGRLASLLLGIAALSPARGITQALTPTIAPCLHYEPHGAAITGKLVTEPHYGPPNFGETPSQDAKLDVTVLLLSHAVDVCGDPTSATDQDTVRNVTKIQVVATRLKLKAFIGLDVTLTGRLYEAFTGNHFTKVLMFVDSIRPIDRKASRL